MEHTSQKRKGTKTINCSKCMSNFPQNGHDNSQHMYLIGQQKQIPFAGFALVKLFSICLHSLPLSSQWNFTAFIHWSSGKRPQLDFNTVPISVYFALAKLIKFYRLLFPPLISKHIYIKMFRSNENMFKSALATIESRNCNTRIFLHSSLIA